MRTTVASRRLLGYIAAAALVVVPVAIFAALPAPRIPLHYAANGNFAADGRYRPREAGFNLADVSSPAQLDQLGSDVRALVWVGKCHGADETFQTTVQPFLKHSKVFGFYLADDPDPRGLEAGKLVPSCTPESLKAESDWIHENAPGAVTFITLMNLSSAQTPSYKDSYTPANTHVDLFGINPYPCRSELNGCDLDMIDRYVAAARAWGIPVARIVPLYQVFGKGNWDDGNGGQYLLPTPEETRKMLDRWRVQIEAPAFEAVYSWGSQQEDAALEDAPELQAVFSIHNRAGWKNP